MRGWANPRGIRHRRGRATSSAPSLWNHPATGLHKGVSPETSQWVQLNQQLLDRGEVAEVVVSMQQLPAEDETARNAQRTSIEYFQKNKRRMRYACFRSQGLFIGSGVIEAGCKTIIGQRLKQSGMRWTVRGANAIIALRCCQLSHRWEEFWEARSAG